MKKLLALICLVLALVSLSALAASADTETSLWPAYDPETELWGYITEDGKWGIEPQWERAYHFHGGCAIVDTKDVPSWQGESTQGIIDETGVYLLEPAYNIDDACCMDGAGELYLVNQYDDERGSGWFNIPNRYFSGLHWTECYATRKTPYIPVNIGYDLDGLADRATGEIVVPLEYSTTGLYDWGIDGGFIVAERDDTGECELIEIGWGVVEMPEGVVIDYYPGVTEGLIAFQQDGLYGYLNTEGEIVIPAQYDLVEGFVDGYAEVSLPEEVGISRIIDRQGRTVLKLRASDDDAEVRYIGMVDGAFLVISNHDSWSLIEKDGTVRCHYAYPENACDVRLFDVAPDAPLEVLYYLADEEYAFGLLSREGEWVVEPRWDALGSVDEQGWRAACVDGEWVWSDFVGTWGYVDLWGNTVLPFIYEDAGHFEGALARVMLDEITEAYINRSGEIVYQWPMQEE